MADPPAMKKKKKRFCHLSSSNALHALHVCAHASASLSDVTQTQPCMRDQAQVNELLCVVLMDPLTEELAALQHFQE